MRSDWEGAGLIARFPQRDLRKGLRWLAKFFGRHISFGRIAWVEPLQAGSFSALCRESRLAAAMEFVAVSP